MSMRGKVPWIAVFLALLHGILSLWFSSVTPFRQPGLVNGIRHEDLGAPDEPAHANYVNDLLLTGRLPVLSATPDPLPWNYERHQGPLFYVLAAGWARLAGHDAVETEAQARWIRALNSLIGSATVLATFLLGRFVGLSDAASMFASAIVALLPMNIAIDGAISNDPLIALLSTTCLLALCRPAAPSIATAALVGALGALCVLAKSTGVMMVPVVLVVMGYRSWRHLAVAAAMFILIAGPLWFRNVQLYGDPLGMAAFQGRFRSDVNPETWVHHPYDFAHWAYVLLSGTALSAIGIFGYMDIHLSNWVYLPLVATLLTLLILGVWRVKVGSKKILLCFAGLVALGYLGFNLRYVQPQARYLFPAIAVGAILIAHGAQSLGPIQTRRLATAIGMALLIVDIFVPRILSKGFAERIAGLGSREHAPLIRGPHTEN